MNQSDAELPMPRLIDSHTHVDQYDESELPGVLERARAAGLGGIIAAGVTLESSERCVRIADDNAGFVWAGVGVHPMDVTAPLGQQEIGRLTALADNPRVVCVSEIGLDWMPGRPDRAVQEQAFRAQIRMAVDLGLPVVFHNRDAGHEPLRILREEAGTRVPAVVHYFQGPPDYARACLDQGMFVSLAKPLLRLPELQDIVRTEVPLDRIVLETDSYPQPFKKNRDRWTEPRDLPLVAAMVAELKDVPLDEVVATTDATLRAILPRLSSPEE